MSAKPNRKQPITLTLLQKLEILKKLKAGVSKNDLIKEYNVSLYTVYRIKISEAELREKFESMGDASTKTVKHPVTLSLCQKHDVLKKLEDGIPANILAKEYDIVEATVHSIKRQADQLYQDLEISKNLHRKRKRVFESQGIDERLYRWFLQQRDKSGCITDAMLIEKANQINAEINGPSTYTATKGWIWRFKRRHNINLQIVHGEVPDTDIVGAKVFVQNILQRLEDEDIDLQNVYNVDESGLMWKCFPHRCFAINTEGRIQGNKVQKDRITIAFCANALGTHKLPPILIHKYANPRALKHCHDQLSVVYKYQKNAIMTRDIFLDWYENNFKPDVRKDQLERGSVPGKVLLIVDNSSSHIIPNNYETTDNFEIVVLPSNTPTIFQPMNQNIITKVKSLYRQHMLKQISNLPRGITQFFVSYDIKDCIDILNQAWLDITSTNICNSWNKILGKSSLDTKAEEEDNSDEIYKIVCRIAGKPVDPLTVDEWISLCEETESRQVTSKDTANASVPRLSQTIDKVTPQDIEQLFATLLSWAETQSQSTRMHLKCVKAMYKQYSIEQIVTGDLAN